MKKLVLPVLTAAALLNANSAQAQMNGYNDPFNSFFDTMFLSPQKIDAMQFVGPKMDVADLKDKIEVKAELPGMDEHDVKLTCRNNVLTLSGERKQEAEEQNKDYYLKETSSGSFSRSIRLPQNIDASKITAVFKKGILLITIPKTELKDDNTGNIPITSED